MKNKAGEELKIKNTFFKVGCCSPKLVVGNVPSNSSNIIDLIKSHSDYSILLFPELSLTGYTCQDLFFQQKLLDDVETGLKDILEETKEITTLVIVSFPYRYKNKLYNVAGVISSGKLLGMIPKINIPNYGEFYEKRWFESGKDILNIEVEFANQKTHFGTNLMFVDSNSLAKVGVEICEDLWMVNRPSNNAILNGCNIIVNPSASNETISKASYRRNLVLNQSGSGYACYMYCSSNTNESSQDLIFSGHCIIANNGSLLNEIIYPKDDTVLESIIDLQENEYNRIHQSTFSSETKDDFYEIHACIQPIHSNNNLYNVNADQLFSLLDNEHYSVDKYPFIPKGDAKRKERCLEILKIQTEGLKTRIKNTGIKDLVLGISGGLDSTLALLVAYNASNDIEGVKIHAITMPMGGNTTSLTYNNATSLMKELNVISKEIKIDNTVLSHLKDLEHSSDVLDITYENAQARCRTYILMDYANMVNGLVIGTGDLSELALGWCTYNGDHMSMYSVNNSIPKTLVKYLIETYANCFATSKLKETLLSILDTPISPELKPSVDGKISQKTEESIGKYDLNDFFMYYFLRYGFRPSKIYVLAKLAFKEVVEEDILKSLKNFYRRFFNQQFKRSCMPDGIKVGSLSLSPRGDYRMPSDVNASSYLDELEKL